jgi:hypothetical protein
MRRARSLPAILLALTTAPCCANAQAQTMLRSLEVAQDGACLQTHIRLTAPVRATAAIPDGTATEIVIPLETIGTSQAGSAALDGPAGNVAGLKRVRFETTTDGSRLRIVFIRPVSYHLVMDAETRHVRIDTSGGSVTSCTGASTAAPVPAIAMVPADPVSQAAVDALPVAPAQAGTGTSPALIDNASSLRGTVDPDTSLKSLLGNRTPTANAAHVAWTVTGSASQSYYRNDLFASAHTVEDSWLISGISVQANGENRDWAAAAKLDALQQTGIGMPADVAKNNLSTAYLELTHKRSQTTARLGRQTRNDGGIFGRFDGAWLGLEATNRLGFGLAAGSPVYASDQTPFADNVAFLSARATYALRPSVLFADIYAIEQHAGTAVDRRALGAEIRHETRDLAAYTGADFDIYQNRWSSAYASTNWQATERLAVNAALDYRTTPFLLASNALSGQDADTLPSLMRLLGENQVLALAGDRTAAAVTASLGLSYQISERWQVTLDGLLMGGYGTPASGGALGTPGAGTDLYISAYAYGEGLLVPNGSGGFGLSIAQNERMSKLSGDVFLRYPLTDKLTLSPRLRTSVRQTTDGPAVKIAPSLGARYRLDKHWLLETELGVSFDSRSTFSSDRSTETQALVGYRYEF